MMDNVNLVAFNLVSLCFFIILATGCASRKKNPNDVISASDVNSQKNTDALSEKTSGATRTMKKLGVEQKPIKNNMSRDATTPEIVKSKDASTPEKKADPQNTENEPNLENAMKETKTAAEDEEEAKNLKDKRREEMTTLVAAGAALLVPASKEVPTKSADELVLKTAQGTTKGTEKTDATVKVKKYEGELEVNPLQLTWEQKEMTQKLIISNKKAAQIYVVKLKCSDNTTFKIQPVYGSVAVGGDLEIFITQTVPPAKRPNKLVIDVIKLDKAESASDSGKVAEVFKREDVQKDSIIVPLLIK
ncbi:unnamed protein product, partial [Mesorhabditis belari]|uniref:MSP domain-containing protein n=1 Tax=Mesorhabditis belari TaxID=2138241 RepID=A0AAF3FI56_9BILA